MCERLGRGLHHLLAELDPPDGALAIAQPDAVPTAVGVACLFVNSSNASDTVITGNTSPTLGSPRSLEGGAAASSTTCRSPPVGAPRQAGSASATFQPPDSPGWEAPPAAMISRRLDIARRPGPAHTQPARTRAERAR